MVMLLDKASPLMSSVPLFVAKIKRVEVVAPKLIFVTEVASKAPPDTM